MIKFPLVIGLVLALTSCAGVVDRQGTQVDLYPVEYAVGFDLADVSQKQADKQLESFIDQYWALIITQPVELLATTPQGLMLATQTRRNLLKRGIQPENIVLKHQTSVSPHDFKMSIIQYEVVTPRCTYSTLNNYDAGAEGCFVESARWSSIIRPERMLPQHIDATVSE
jgi:hypothetical protein